VAQNALADKIAELRKLPNEVGNGHDVKSGSVVVLDVKDGGVLTSASWPGYDVSSFSADYAEIAADPDRPLFNRALMGSFVVGSTVKPGVALAAITEGIIQPNTLIDCTRKYTYFEDFQPNCLGHHGNIAVKTALSKSCNYYFYEVGRRLGGAALCQYYSLYGFGTRTGIEVGESEGVFRTPDNYVTSNGVGWTPGTSLQNASGQVSQVTPMQLAAYCMMFANNGVRYKTHLLYSLRGYDGVSETVYEPEVAASVQWNEKAIAAVKAGMLECVKTGTAAKYFEGITYTLAAKTGTAQTGVSTWSDHGCFIGYAPADNPEVAIAVVMERGKSAAASQVARVVLDAYFERRSGVNKPDDIGSLLP
jgi:penicillin-binding protein 2